jgi:hypothetical protein
VAAHASALVVVAAALVVAQPPPRPRAAPEAAGFAGELCVIRMVIISRLDSLRQRFKALVDRTVMQ